MLIIVSITLEKEIGCLKIYKNLLAIHILSMILRKLMEKMLKYQLFMENTGLSAVKINAFLHKNHKIFKH